MKFTGTDSCIATDDLKLAINSAMVLGRTLLVKGEPGTGIMGNRMSLTVAGVNQAVALLNK